MVPLRLQTALYRLHIVLSLSCRVPVVLDRHLFRTIHFEVAHLVATCLLLQQIVEVGDQLLEGNRSDAFHSQSGDSHLADHRNLIEYFP